MLQTIVEWKEQERLQDGSYRDRMRAFKYDTDENVIVDFEHYEPIMQIPLIILAQKDLKSLKTQEARRIVKFAKEKLGVE